MLKKTPMIATVTGLGSAIAAWAFVPGMVEDTRNFMIEPALQAIEKQTASQTVLMAGMKHYDIRTDELADDVRRLITRIREAQKALAEVPANALGYRQHLERLIRNAEQELQLKQRMLDQATGSDRDILSILQGQTA